MARWLLTVAAVLLIAGATSGVRKPAHAEPQIEEVTAKQLERVLQDKDFVAVYWCKCWPRASRGETRSKWVPVNDVLAPPDAAPAGLCNGDNKTRAASRALNGSRTPARPRQGRPPTSRARRGRPNSAPLGFLAFSQFPTYPDVTTRHCCRVLVSMSRLRSIINNLKLYQFD